MIDAFKGEYRWLSNFWLEPVPLNGLVYPSVENAYQAAKVDPELRPGFLNITPKAAKDLGHDYACPKSWEEDKLIVMNHLIRAKFRRGSYLAEKLTSTDNVEIIEGNTWDDVFWGVCGGVGENHLGKILMQVRRGLQEPYLG